MRENIGRGYGVATSNRKAGNADEFSEGTTPDVGKHFPLDSGRLQISIYGRHANLDTSKK